MKAAVLEELNTIVVKEIPEPPCGDHEAILKVGSCAVCGSDIRIYHYGTPRVKFPAIMGHEIAGEIIKTGQHVTRVKVGDRIAVGADVPCGRCSWCQSGMGTSCAINYAIGYQFAGGFQEQMVLNETILAYGPVTKSVLMKPRLPNRWPAPLTALNWRSFPWAKASALSVLALLAV
jgi:L-iditol 2-dehydrogenase